MLLPRRQLKPRTFRASVGQTILVGGLARVDLLHLPAQTIYLTVWASDEVSCHYGRTDKAEERCADLQTSHSRLLCQSSPRAGTRLLQIILRKGLLIDLLQSDVKMPCFAIKHSCIQTVHVSLLFIVRRQQIG